MKNPLKITCFLMCSLMMYSTSQGQDNSTADATNDILIVEEEGDEKYFFEIDPTKGFYDQARQGWFSFEDPDKLIVPEPTDENPSGGGKAEKLEPFSNKWFRQNMQALQDKAIDNPTEKNVRIYLIVQRVMMDKAERFAEVASNVSFGDPLLDEGRQRSLSGGGMHQQAKLGRENTTKVLKDIAVSSGLFYFTKADCRICEQQESVITRLSERYGFTFKKVSIDGSPLTGEYLVDGGQASAMGIDRAPSLAFYNPETEFFRTLSQNAISLVDLRERILMAAAQGNLISDAAYASTKRINPIDDLAVQLKGSPIDPMESPDEFLLQFGGYRSSSNSNAYISASTVLSKDIPNE